MQKEISLYDLICYFWQAKYYLLIGALIGFLATLFYLYVAISEYKAIMVVAPADGYALGDYASSIEYDRMAALPFWRPKDQEGASTDFYRFIHTLRGPAAAKILMQDEKVVTDINKTLQDKIETPEELAIYLERNVRIDPLGATPLRRISYLHPNPDFASALLRKLHLVADQMIRRDRRRQSQSRIDYLQNSLRKTTNPDHRKGITNLLMQQEHIQMLANLDEAYAAIVVEPASTLPKPAWPNKPLSFAVALFIGLMLGFMIWSIRQRAP